MIQTRSFARFALPAVACATYIFLYLPIAVLVFFSFNDGPLPYAWAGFTTRWYTQLFNSPEVWMALKNTLIIALSSVFLSVTMGLLFVCWSYAGSLRRYTSLFYASVALPEIVMAVSLLSFFSFFYVPLGIGSLIAGHTLLGLGFVIPIVRTQFLELDYRLTEASFDLGASEMQTFFKITVPLLMPSLIASALLVFILSLDDFLISFFCSGATAQTLSLYIFAMIRLGVSQEINAISTMMLVASSALVLLFCSLKINNRVF